MFLFPICSTFATATFIVSFSWSFAHDEFTNREEIVRETTTVSSGLWAKNKYSLMLVYLYTWNVDVTCQSGQISRRLTLQYIQAQWTILNLTQPITVERLQFFQIFFKKSLIGRSIQVYV